MHDFKSEILERYHFLKQTYMKGKEKEVLIHDFLNCDMFYHRIVE